MRASIAASIFILFVASFSFPLLAQTVPVPFVNDPLVPMTVAPGGPAFTLTVNGAGFVSGDVVNWNGSPRATTVVSNTKVTAQIPASDIAAPGTAYVSVVNSKNGISNSVLFQIASPTASLAFTRADTNVPFSGASSLVNPVAMLAGDFSTSHQSVLAILNPGCPVTFGCILSKGSVVLTYGSALLTSPLLSIRPSAFAAGGSGFTVLGNNSPGNYLYTGSGTLTPAPSAASGISTADFNGDGIPDAVLGSFGSVVYVLLGNSDGTFGMPASFSAGSNPASVAIGDFNGDGKLDLAAANLQDGTISILLGNGDGTFQTQTVYPAGNLPSQFLAADFNGDGKLDLAVLSGNTANDDTTISILLGKGDGTFLPKVDYPAGIAMSGLTVGDFNADGIPDLAAADYCSNAACATPGTVHVLLGNGDGTFQSHLDFASGQGPLAIVTGDFSRSNPLIAQITGRPGFAVLNSDDSVSVYSAISTGANNPLPTISSISPTSAMLNSGAFTLTVNGTNFISTSTVHFGGQPRATTFVSASQLTAAIQPGDLGAAGEFDVLVSNPPPGGGNSTASPFNVYGPAPAISSLNPSSVVAGGPAFTLTVNGLNFVNGAAVNFNGAGRLATFVNSSQLTVAVTASDIATPSTINISVTVPVGNGSLGGATSSLPLTVLPVNTQPVIGGLVPASTTAGGPAFTLILNGSGFTTSSVVTFKSAVVSSAFVSATQLQAAIPASAIAVGGTPFVTVANPGGNPSVVATFTVNNPAPGATSLSPSTVPAGNAATTLNVTGANFNSSSVVFVNASTRATTYVNSSTLSAALPASDFASSGMLNVTINNPTPGGGTTAPLSIVVEDFNVAASTASNSAVAGQSANFSLMLMPANKTTANPVTFSASGMPAGAAATFSPSTVPAGSGMTTVMLAIATTPHSAASSSIFPRAKFFWTHGHWLGLVNVLAAVLAVGFCCFAARVRRQTPQFLLAALLILAAGLAACGGGSYAPSSPQLDPKTGTPTGSYPIVVTATAGGGSLSTTVTLTVM